MGTIGAGQPRRNMQRGREIPLLPGNAISLDRRVNHGANTICNLRKSLLANRQISISDFSNFERAEISAPDEVGVEVIHLEQATVHIVWATEIPPSKQQGVGLVGTPGMPLVAPTQVSPIGEMAG